MLIGMDEHFELKGGGVSEASFPKIFEQIINFWAFAECPKIISLAQKKVHLPKNQGGCNGRYTWSLGASILLTTFKGEFIHFKILPTPLGI